MDRLLVALKAVADPTRLRLLVLCAHMDLTVSQLVRILGQSQPRVSRHLKLLADAGLLDRVQEGSWVFYRSAKKGAAAELGRTLVDATDDQDPVLSVDLTRLDELRRERAELAAAYFKRNAGHWDDIRKRHIDEAIVEQALLSHFPEGDVEDLLDIGTGTAGMMSLLAGRVGTAVGIDFSREMLTVARANIESQGLRNCQVQQGDMYQLPMPNQSFDAVTIHQVLHYAEEPRLVIREAARVLRPGGRLLIVDFKKHELDDMRSRYHHRWLGFDSEELQEWFNDNDLAPGPAEFLEGESLTVGIWKAERPQHQEAA